MSCQCKKWSWNSSTVPAELHPMLRSLGELFDICEDPAGSNQLQFQRIEGEGLVTEVSFSAPDKALIGYNTVASAARGIGSVLANISGRETTPFTMLGIMLDLSRNIVFTVPAMQRLFRRLALLGFNTVFLYCEDTYELEGEPAFGMMRGRYTAGEIRTMDDMASAVGIELIGCIQTLGHMAQILQWNASYGAIKDTASVMRVDAPETHTLIGKMLDFWKDNLRSRRIHVGMDETHDLGRGRYMDINGFKSGFDLFTGHLNKVNDACLERGLQPMIWSDMFFRLGNQNQDYYDLNSVIPQEVRDSIPKTSQLVYWDYYHSGQDFYEKFIDMHRDLGVEPLMAAGVWIWSRLWCDAEHNSVVNRACINACRSRELKEIFFTMWGDDGAICHFDSAWTGLTEASDLAFGIDCEKTTSDRYKALCGGDYKVARIPAQLHCRGSIDGHPLPQQETDMSIFWDDILLGLAVRNLQVMEADLPEILQKRFARIAGEIEPHRFDKDAANLNYGWLIAQHLRDKLAVRIKLEKAYRAGDKAALKEIADTRMPHLAEQLEAIMLEFRKQWLDNGKVFGLETMQHRMGGVLYRYREASRRINDYVSGVCDKLEELEQLLPDKPERMRIYSEMASGSVFV